MASRVQKTVSNSVGFAGSGAAIGGLLGAGPIGAGIGAGIGFLTGLFSGDDEELQSPSFADINLETENPDLFKRLKAQDLLINEARTLYDTRRKSTTAQEQRDYQAYLAETGKNIQHGGLAGTSDGMMLSSQANQGYQDKLAERIYKEQMGLLENYQGALGRGFDMNRQALGDVMNAKSGQFQHGVDVQSANNDYYSSLFQGGANALGSAYNAYQYANAPKTPINVAAMPGPGYSFGTPVYTPQAQTAPYYLARDPFNG